MKKTSRKLATGVLAVLLLVFALFPIAAQAATGTQDGLDVSLTTDKSSYVAGDTVAVTVTVTNTNAVAVNNVKLEITLPSGLTLQTGNTSVTIASLAAGATETRSLTALAVAASTSEPTTQTTSTTQPGSPQTGDASNLPLWVGLLVLSVGGLAGLLYFKRRKGAKFLSMFLCFVLLTAVVAPALPVQAAAMQKSFTINESVTVDGTAKQITLKTSYDWDDGVSNTYSLSVNNANGQPSTDYGTVAITTGTAANNIEGTSVTVTATPKTGYSFWKWVDNNSVAAAEISTNAAYTFNITTNTTLYAVFSKDSAGLPYTFTSGSISAGSAATGALVIPNVIDKQIVTQIGSECFDNNDNITSVAIPSTVTVINGYAFQYCNNLASVTFGADSQLTTINKDAFYELPLLTSFVFPATVTYVGGQSFAYSGLQEVTFLGNRPAISNGLITEAFRCCDSLNSVYYTASNTIGWPGDDINAGREGPDDDHTFSRFITPELKQ